MISYFSAAIEPIQRRHNATKTAGVFMVLRTEGIIMNSLWLWLYRLETFRTRNCPVTSANIITLRTQLNGASDGHLLAH